jgi:hypothetical protein
MEVKLYKSFGLGYFSHCFIFCGVILNSATKFGLAICMRGFLGIYLPSRYSCWKNAEHLLQILCRCLALPSDQFLPIINSVPHFLQLFILLLSPFVAMGLFFVVCVLLWLCRLGRRRGFHIYYLGMCYRYFLCSFYILQNFFF